MQRKWFVHIQGTQEGPMTLEDVQVRLARGSATLQDFAWSEGMETWQRIEAVPELNRPLAVAPAGPAPADLGALIEIRPEEVEPPKKRSPRKAKEADAPAPTLLTPEAQTVQRGRPARMTAAILAVGLAAGGAYASFFGYWDKWFPPVPKVEELGQEENQELLQAASQSLSREGPALAVALATQNAGAPAAFMATNLPEGTRLEVRVHGIGPTLLNEIEFDLVYPIAVAQRSGRTPPIRMKDGSAIPAGQYLVYVVDAGSDQPAASAKALDVMARPTVQPVSGVPQGRRILGKKIYTVLGGLRDETYSSLLRDYHAKLREQAASEARELADWTGLLGRQLAGTRSTFERLLKKTSGEARQRAWSEYHEEWAQDLSEDAGKWDMFKPGAAMGKVFYGPLYEQVYLAWQSLSRLHDVQTAALAPPADLPVFEPELKTLVEQTTSRITGIQDKLSTIEKSWNKSGYPPREGIL